MAYGHKVIYNIIINVEMKATIIQMYLSMDNRDRTWPIGEGQTFTHYIHTHIPSHSSEELYTKVEKIAA